MKLKSFKTKRKFTTGTALLVVTIVVSALMLTRTDNLPSVDTSNWKSYSSPKMNFRIKYPGSVSLHDYADQTYQEGYETVQVYPRIEIRFRNLNPREGPYSGKRELGLTMWTFPSDYKREGQYTGMPDSAYKEVDSSKIIEQNLEIEGHSYKLIDYGEFLGVATCQSHQNCASAIKRPDGTYIAFMINEWGDSTKPALKHDSSNPDYVTLVNIIKTARFN